jgi:RimJ/RimL family protein N-acetyltransferase
VVRRVVSGIAVSDEDSLSTGFVTERLVATPLRSTDAEDLFPVLADPLLHRYIGGEPPASLDVLLERYTSLESQRSPDGRERWLNWTLRTKATGTAIGYLQATVGTREVLLAWVVGTAWQGNGFAKEAVRALVRWVDERFPSHELVAAIHPEHGASISVARSAGLEPTNEIDDGEVVWRAHAPPTDASTSARAGNDARRSHDRGEAR